MEGYLERLVTFGATHAIKEADTACLYAYFNNEELPRYHEFIAPDIQCIVVMRGNEIVLVKVVCQACSAIVMKDHPGHFSGLNECFPAFQTALLNVFSQFHHLQYLQCHLFRSAYNWL